MMDQMPMVSLFGLHTTLYALLAIAGYLLLGACMVFLAPKAKLPRSAALLYALLAGALGLLLGRGIYCAVRVDTLFYGSMGEFLGLAPFFDTSVGSVSVVGVLLGVVLAAPLCSLITGRKAAALLDLAVVPGMLYFILMRFIEHLGGYGNGDLVMEPALCFFPIARANEWGDYFLAVNTIEAILGVIVLIGLLLLKKKAHKPGSLALYAATLLSVSQIIPESLRWDDVLYVFIFARVTHLGLAVMLFMGLLIPLLKGLKNGLDKKTFWLELSLMLAGIALCIGTIFALDKTNLPKLLVYGVMLLALIGLAILNCRRIHKEDIRS